MIRKESPHAKEEFSRKVKVPFWNHEQVAVATPEDVIIKKLDFYRQGGSEKHLKDIRGILAETKIDKKYLEKWVDGLGLAKEWGTV